MEIALSGVLGAVFGSFLNVVAFRLPRGESVVRPRSRCPACGTPIKPYDNIPLVSYLLLRGRCRACKAPIPWRYPLIEALTAGLCVAVVLTRHGAAPVALGLCLVLLVIPAAAIDLAYRIIPNRLLAVGGLAAVAFGSALDPGGEPKRLIAAAAAGGAFFAIALLYPQGMGMGDVKLIAVLGLLLGPGVAVCLLAALASGTAVGLWLVATREGVGRKTAVPFGPFLAFGGLAALFFGHPLVHLYIHQLLGR